MDVKVFDRRVVSTCCICILAGALAGCATGGGTVSSGHASPAPAQAGQAADAAGQDAGPIRHMLQAIGLDKQPGRPTSYALPLRIFTAGNLNAARGDQGLALVLKVYHLRSPEQFEQAPFNDFLDSHAIRDDLGDSLIDSRQMMLLPGQHYVSTEHLPPAATYVGFVALFRGPAAHRWRFVYSVPKSTASGITLGVHACALSSTAGALVTQLAEPADSLASVHCPKPGS